MIDVLEKVLMNQAIDVLVTAALLVAMSVAKVNSHTGTLGKNFGGRLAPREWGKALEALTTEAGKLPNNFHGEYEITEIM